MLKKLPCLTHINWLPTIKALAVFSGNRGSNDRERKPEKIVKLLLKKGTSRIISVIIGPDYNEVMIGIPNCQKYMYMYLGDNFIQNFHLRRYIVSYMVGNFVLQRRISRAVKRNFRRYKWRYTSPNENFEYGYPHSNALFIIYSSKAQHFAPNWSFVSNAKQLRQPITYDISAPTVYCRIYWRKFLTLSNQMSHYICKCIRMSFNHELVFTTMLGLCKSKKEWKSACFSGLYWDWQSLLTEPRHEKTCLRSFRPG